MLCFSVFFSPYLSPEMGTVKGWCNARWHVYTYEIGFLIAAIFIHEVIELTHHGRGRGGLVRIVKRDVDGGSPWNAECGNGVAV